MIVKEVSAMPGVEKEPMLRQVQSRIDAKPYLFFNRLERVTVKDMEELRRSLTKVSDHCFMAKNKILGLALDARGAGTARKFLGGQVFLVAAKEEPQAVSKVLVSFAKEKENFKLVGGWMEGQLYEVPMIQELAKLPSRRELLAKVVGCMNSPVAGWVGVLGGLLRNLVVVLNQIGEKKERLVQEV